MVRTILFSISLLFLLLSGTSCMSWFKSVDTDPSAALKLSAAGAALPNAKVQRSDGTTIGIQDLTRNKHTILIFYRGGWCPYCTKHLQEIGKVEQELTRMGWQIFAISPDQPEKIRETMVKEKPQLRLLSDSGMTLARRLGLAFTVDDATLEAYQGYGIHLQEWSGQNHNRLPVPAVFLIKPDGTIAWRQADPDYRNRVDGETLLAAARQAMQN